MDNEDNTVKMGVGISTDNDQNGPQNEPLQNQVYIHVLYNDLNL